MLYISYRSSFFFFNDTATTEIYTLSLHDALPISALRAPVQGEVIYENVGFGYNPERIDRKSTRLNSSHRTISYAVFCLKKKKKLKRPYSFSLSLQHPLACESSNSYPCNAYHHGTL